MQIVRPNTKVQTLDLELGKWKIWDVLPGRRSGAEEPDSDHLEVLSTALSKEGHAYWNNWRRAHPSIKPNLCWVDFAVAGTPTGPVGVNLSGYDLSDAVMNGCQLAFAKLNGTNLSGAKLRESLINQSTIVESDLSGADLTQASMSALTCIRTKFDGADLSRALLHASKVFGCSFDDADFEAASLDAAILSGSSFRGASLRSANAGGCDLTGCDLTSADLSHAHLVKTNLSAANLTRARVYGVNCWDVETTEETIQQELILSQPKEPVISVDDIRVAQFVRLILNNDNIRSVIDTIGRKAVLVLGRFGGGGIDVLHSVANGLRDLGYLPIIFEFARPENRNYTEVVRTLAGLARFVVVDLSGPSVPHELYATVPHTKIPFIPILEHGRKSYSMFADLLEYDWVREPILEFESVEALCTRLKDDVVTPAEAHIERRQERLKRLHAD